MRACSTNAMLRCPTARRASIRGPTSRSHRKDKLPRDADRPARRRCHSGGLGGAAHAVHVIAPFRAVALFDETVDVGLESGKFRVEAPGEFQVLDDRAIESLAR